MRNTWILCAAMLVLTSTTLVQADDRVKLISSTLIWGQAPRELGSDLVRFQDQWLVAYTENSEAQPGQSAVRVIASQDGKQWEPVALLESTTPNRGVYSPKFSVSPAGQLMIAGVGVIPNYNAAEPVPKYGGTVNTLAWFSDDGRDWSKIRRIGQDDFPFGRVVWNNDAAFTYGNGCICGSAQTIQVFSSDNGRHFLSRYKETFSGFFPGDAALAFGDATAVCLMSRNNGQLGSKGWQTGFVGTAEAPFDHWQWKAINDRIGFPNLIRLSDGRVIAAVGIKESDTRTSLCELDPATGELTELIELPTQAKLMPVGLALHDGHLWVSYHASPNGLLGVYLAQVAVD